MWCRQPRAGVRGAEVPPGGERGRPGGGGGGQPAAGALGRAAARRRAALVARVARRAAHALPRGRARALLR